MLSRCSKRSYSTRTLIAAIHKGDCRFDLEMGVLCIELLLGVEVLQCVDRI